MVHHGRVPIQQLVKTTGFLCTARCTDQRSACLVVNLDFVLVAVYNLSIMSEETETVVSPYFFSSSAASSQFLESSRGDVKPELLMVLCEHGICLFPRRSLSSSWCLDSAILNSSMGILVSSFVVP